ncbi:hypothetical protein IAT40_002241 [Kwoniella sp. CBS 6097]
MVQGGKRKSMASRTLGNTDDRDVDGDAERKKRKGPVKKPAFKPQPVPLPNSSNTPPEDDLDDMHILPPPPTGRKIARNRDSTMGLRERQHSASPPTEASLFSSGQQGTTAIAIASGSSSTGSKRQKRENARGKSVEPVRAAANTSDDPLEGVEETVSMRTTNTGRPQVNGLNVPASHRPTSSAPRPTSPPRRTFPTHASSSQQASKSSMGPPKGFVRKTRQSMSARNRYETSEDSVVPVLQSETPVIRKNQELRGQQARRSSLDHRGGRASSSWGRGEITMPHRSVDSKLFYRHIPVSYPDPIKARMLLVWCANRAVDDALKPSSRRDKGKGKAKPTREEGITEEGDAMLKDIMDEFVREMNRGAVDTSVFGLPGQNATTPGLKPHPRNVSNRRVEAETSAGIRKFKEEGAHWNALIKSTNAKQDSTIHRLRQKKAVDSVPDMSKADDWVKETMRFAEGVIAQGEGDLSEVGEFADVEYKVDTLLQSSHVALQYALQSSRFLDGIFSALAADLRARDRAGAGAGPGAGLGSSSSSSSILNDLPIHSDEGPDLTRLLATTLATTTTTTSSSSSSLPNQQKKKNDPMSLLRVLASTESKEADLTTVEKAMKIPPVPVQVQVPSVPSIGMGMGAATPRKGAMTPRRAAATPGRGR